VAPLRRRVRERIEQHSDALAGAVRDVLRAAAALLAGAEFGRESVARIGARDERARDTLGGSFDHLARSTGAPMRARLVDERQHSGGSGCG